MNIFKHISLTFVKKNLSNAKLKAAIISLVLAVFLFAVKTYAYYLTHSSAVFSDALESIVNIVSGIISVIVIIVSLQPADKDHPYGHGKIELIASGLEGGAIFVAGFLIIMEATHELIVGVQLKNLDFGLVLIIGAALVNGLLGGYLVRTGKKTNSQALTASGQHILSDFWTSLGVVIGLILVKLTGILWLDPIAAIIVALNICFTGYRLVFQAGRDLMDASDLALIEEFGRLFEAHAFPGIIRFHHTRLIKSGSFHHIDLHMVVPEYWDIAYAHDKSDEFEASVIKDYDFDGEMHFHLDPCRKKYCTICDVKECPIRLQAFVKRVPFSLEELLSPEESEVIIDPLPPKSKDKKGGSFQPP